MSVAIRLLRTEDEVAESFPVMKELRPHIEDEAQFRAVVRAMLAEGVQFAAGESDGEIVSVASFRVLTMLVTGVTMYVDDLVTAGRARSRGHGKAMLQWLLGYARERGCDHFSLDSGTFRHEAHAFYFREGLRITSFHFARKI